MTIDVQPILTSILSTAASALNEAEDAPAVVHLAPGREAAFDNCCEDGGQLYLRVIDIYPTAGAGSAGFPQPDLMQRGAGCGIGTLALRLGLGLLRCAATLDDQGRPPAPERLGDEVGQAMSDMGTLLTVLACEVRTLPGVHKVKVDRWSPLGVSGGCHGGEWTFYLAVDPCLSC